MKCLLSLVIMAFAGGGALADPSAPTGHELGVSGVSPVAGTLEGTLDYDGSALTETTIYCWTGDDIPTEAQSSGSGLSLPRAVVFKVGSGITAALVQTSSTQTAVTVTANVSGLSPATVYHYRYEGTNSAGTGSADGTFTTAALPLFYALTDSGNSLLSFNPVGDLIASGGQGDASAVEFLYGHTNVSDSNGGGQVNLALPLYEGHFIVRYELAYSIPASEFSNSTPGFRNYIFVRRSGPSSNLIDVTGPISPFNQPTYHRDFGPPEIGVYLTRDQPLADASALPVNAANVPSFKDVNVGDGLPGSDRSLITHVDEVSGSAALVRASRRGRTSRVLLGGIDNLPIGGVSGGTLNVHPQASSSPVRKAVTASGATASRVVVARVGAPLPGKPGIVLREIVSFDGVGLMLFTAKLAGAGVTPRNNSVLCVEDATVGDGSGFRVLARSGQKVAGSQITKITTLKGAAGSQAQGRWRIFNQAVGTRMTLENGREVLVKIPLDSTSPADWVEMATTGLRAGASPQPLITHFGVPSFGAEAVTTLATGRVAGKDGQYLVTASESAFGIVTAEGQTPLNATGEPLLGTSFSQFFAPVSGSQSRFAFKAILTGDTVAADNSSGIWFAADGVTPKLLARTGDMAPGGGIWANLTEIVMPVVPVLDSGNAELETAYLAVSAPRFIGHLVNGVEGVSSANDLGMWGVDSLGGLRLILRTGQTIDVHGTPKVVVSFRALETTLHSTGAAHGYDDDGKVAVVANFSDGQDALLRLGLP